MPIDAFVGMQFGSEGKGAVVARLADKYNAAVRTGAPNAGHSLYHKGILYKMRSVPCAWVNPNAKLCIGAGGLINMHVFEEEMKALPEDVRHRLLIDHQTGIITEQDIEEEERVKMNAKIGSTAEGVGPAAARKLLRRGTTLAKDMEALKPYLANVSEVLDAMLQWGGSIMLEGTQGSGLSLNHGHYPYCTSRDVTASALLTEAGVPPKYLRDVFGVMRTYPIRVAGNSGPMGAEEITWAEVTRRCGAPDGAIVEKTTVTQRIRRVSELSWVELKRSVALNGPSGLFITFIDYIDWKMHGATSIAELTDQAKQFVRRVESTLNVPVMAVCSGPKPEHMIWLRPCLGFSPEVEAAKVSS